MPGTGGKLYAEMVLDVDKAIKSLGQFKKEINDVPSAGKKAAEDISQSFSQSALQIQDAFKGIAQVVGGLALAGSFLKMSKDAAEAETAVLLMKRAFGEVSDEVDSWAKHTAKAMGTSVQSMRKGLSAIQILQKGQRGMSKETVEASKAMTTLGINLAAVFGRTTVEGIDAVTGGLTGNVVALHKFDIIMTQTRVQQFAFARGLRQMVHDLDPLGQSLIKTAFLLHEGVFAIGAAVEMQKTFAGQTKLLEANMLDLSVALGVGVNVALSMLLKPLNSVLGVMGRLRPLILGMIGALGLFATAVIGLSAAWAALAPILKAMLGPLKIIFAQITAWSAVAMASVGSLATAMNALALSTVRLLGPVLLLAGAYGLVRNAIDKLMGKAVESGHALAIAFKRAYDDALALAGVILFEPGKESKSIEQMTKDLDKLLKEQIEAAKKAEAELVKYLATLKKLADPIINLNEEFKKLIKISAMLKLGDKLAIPKVRGFDNLKNASKMLDELTAKYIKMYKTLNKNSKASERQAVSALGAKVKRQQEIVAGFMNADRSPEQEAADKFTQSLTSGPMAINMIEAIGNIAKSGLDAIGSAFGANNFSEQVGTWLSDMFGKGLSMMEGILDSISPGLSSAFSSMAGTLTAALGPMGGIVGLLSSIITMAPAWDHFQQSMEAVMTALAAIFDPILQILAAWLQILGPLIASITSLAMAFQPLLDLIGGPLFYVLKGLALAMGFVTISALKAARWLKSWYSDTSSLDKSIQEAESRQSQVYNMTYESAKRASDAMDKMTGSTRNVPTWYKVATARLKTVAEEVRATAQSGQAQRQAGAMGPGPLPSMPKLNPMYQMHGDTSGSGVQAKILEMFKMGASASGITSNLFQNQAEGRVYVDNVIIQAATNEPGKFAEAFERFLKDFEKRGKPYAA